MRVNNSTIAPFVDQKSMVWQQQTFVEHSKYASAIANFPTKKGKKKKKNYLGTYSRVAAAFIFSSALKGDVFLLFMDYSVF